MRDLRAAWHQDAAIALVSGGCGADLATWSGRPTEALALADDAVVSMARQWGDYSLGGIWLGALGIAASADLAEQGRLVHDDDAVARAVADGDRLLDQVRLTAEKGRPRSGRIGPEGVAWIRRAEAEHARLHASSDAVERWTAALEAFDYGYVYEVARCRRRLAEALLVHDRRDEAADQARAAHEVAVRLGARPLQEAVEALAVRARLDVGVALAAPAQDVLTPRERQVLGLVAEGLTNRQVGARLYISEKTASVHLSNLMAKLGASSRTEAVTIAHRNGHARVTAPRISATSVTVGAPEPVALAALLRAPARCRGGGRGAGLGAGAHRAADAELRAGGAVAAPGVACRAGAAGRHPAPRPVGRRPRAAAAWARECGATPADQQPQDDVRVMLDPDGHPFCLFR